MERPYLPSITALLCSSWFYLNVFLIQLSGRYNKFTREKVLILVCALQICFDLSVSLICIIICIDLFKLLILSSMCKSYSNLGELETVYLSQMAVTTTNR